MKEILLTVTEEEYKLIQTVLQKFLTFEKAHAIIFKLGSQYDENLKKQENGNIQSSKPDGLRNELQKVEDN